MRELPHNNKGQGGEAAQPAIEEFLLLYPGLSLNRNLLSPTRILPLRMIELL